MIARCWGRTRVLETSTPEDLFNPVYGGCFDRLVQLHRYCIEPIRWLIFNDYELVCYGFVFVIFGLCSHGRRLTQPVVVAEAQGRALSVASERTPTVFLIGSRYNIAMLANTLTSTTKLRQPDGSYVQLGNNYKSQLNAR